MTAASAQLAAGSLAAGRAVGGVAAAVGRGPLVRRAGQPRTATLIGRDVVDGADAAGAAAAGRRRRGAGRARLAAAGAGGAGGGGERRDGLSGDQPVGRPATWRCAPPTSPMSRWRTLVGSERHYWGARVALIAAVTDAGRCGAADAVGGAGRVAIDDEVRGAARRARVAARDDAPRHGDGDVGADDLGRARRGRDPTDDRRATPRGGDGLRARLAATLRTRRIRCGSRVRRRQRKGNDGS